MNDSTVAFRLCGRIIVATAVRARLQFPESTQVSGGRLWQYEDSIITLRLSNDDIRLRSARAPGRDITGQIGPV